MPRPSFFWHPDYEIPIGRHVFPTLKFRLLRDYLVENNIVRAEEVITPEAPTDAQLLTVLTPEYLADLRGYQHTRRTLRSELPISRQIIEGCAMASGGTIACAKAALEHGAACHFGGGFHHGFADHAEGFCYVNDVAIAAATVRAEGLCRRIAVIDTDVHQGNGTAHIFRDEQEVFTFSIHQERLYPEKQVSDLDIGLDEEIGDEAYLAALEAGLDKAVDEFKPEFILYVAGVDPYEEDQLGNLGLSFNGMRDRDAAVLRRAAAQGIPFATVLAGGYSRDTHDVVRLHAQTISIAIEAARDALFRTRGSAAARP